MKRLRIIISFLFVFSELIAQETKLPFRDEIQAFKKQDSIHMPAKNQILFVGSSSFAKWTDVQDYFPSYPIINRGFGGSSLPDVIRYANDIIYPYQPKQIVIYCGENDIAGDTSVTGKIVFKRFIQLYWNIQKNLLNVPIIYISMKPSPDRWRLKEKMRDGNYLIQQYLKKKKRGRVFIDVWNAMLDSDSKPMEELFLEDKLHMNEKGYAIWQKLIQPYLLK